MNPLDAVDREAAPSTNLDPCAATPTAAAGNLPLDSITPKDGVSSVILQAPPALPTAEELAPAEPPSVTKADDSAGGGAFLFRVTIFMLLMLIGAYTAPYMIAHWRGVDTNAEAEATYSKRRAELRAEAEAADERLQLLDKRVQLVSLGFREVVKKVAPLVVNVANFGDVGKAGFDGKGPRPRVFDPDKDRQYVQNGVGSGILIRPGVVLTNYHVVKGADRLRVTFASGASLGLDPDAVAIDPLTDLAVIRLVDDLPARVREDANQTAAWANSDADVQVGDWALAVGSPLGLRQTVTQGVISAKGRLLAMLDMVELLQTDAAINPGNSGGPLFDQLGRIAGINVAIASDNGQSQGIGFAIPSNLAKKIADELVDKGQVVRGYLGIALSEVLPHEARAVNLGDLGAVKVTEVIIDEAASKAGFRRGDIITHYNQEALSKSHPTRHLRQLIFETAPEMSVAVTVRRGGQHLTLQARIGKRPTKLPGE
jgi:S1-C subfamily serine protease